MYQITVKRKPFDYVKLLTEYPTKELAEKQIEKFQQVFPKNIYFIW